MTAITSVTTEHASSVTRLIEAFVNGDPAAAGALVTDDVVGWSPALHVTSREDLLAAFEDREGAFTDVEVTVDKVDVIRDRAIAEWRAAANFTGDLTLSGATVPPTGERIYLAGATFSEFNGQRICSFRHYFDDAAILEQLLGLS